MVCFFLQLHGEKADRFFTSRFVTLFLPLAYIVKKPKEKKVNRNYFNSNHNYNKSYDGGNQNLSSFMKRPPTAWASVRGNENYPSVKGTVRFYQMSKGVLVVSEFDGLPQSSSPCESPVFAFHIHDGSSCENSGVQQPNENGQLPGGNGGVPQPNEQFPGGNDNTQPPTENEIIPPNNIPNTFPNARAHYNPHDCHHPYHAGDMPPLFGADGYAFLTFVTSRFTVNEIIGKTIIVHSEPDDFSTQPSGNAGEKIACGVIISM